MALTYYIRSWDPRSTYPSNPKEGDICYTITKDQTWAPVGGVKKDNIVKEEIYQNGAWVEQGGGSSKTYYVSEQSATITEEELSPTLTFTDSIFDLSVGDTVTVFFNGSDAETAILQNGFGGKYVSVEFDDKDVEIGIPADSSDTAFLNVYDENGNDVLGTYTVAMYTIEGGGGGEVVLPIVTVDIDNMTYTCTTPYDDLVSLIENSPYQTHNTSDMFPGDTPILPICADNFGEEPVYGYAWSFNMPGYVSGICAYLISNGGVQTIFLYADGSISNTPKQG